MLLSNVSATRSLLLTWVVIYLTIIFYASSEASSFISWGYLVLTTILQTSLLTFLLILLLPLTKIGRTSISIALFHLSAISLMALIFSNYKLHSMYNFFIDGFVINLLSTPGGIEALGLSPSFYKSALIGALFTMIIYFIIVGFVPLEILAMRRPKIRHIALGLLSIFIIETSAFAYSSYTANTSILSIASKIVWHIPVTARGFLEQVGVESGGDSQISEAAKKNSGTLSYPVTNLDKYKITKPYNIIWLTAESLRHDMVDKRIMPNTYRFAQNNSWFKSHYSGGNGTRLGMFSQFYGIYGSYWFDFLLNRTPPLLITALQDHDYKMKAFTSARFTYPEFDKTVFSTLKPEQLQEYRQGVGWQRDKKNTADLIEFIDSQNGKSSPFFTFMFFESAHANYYFPSESIIENDYLDDFDYLSVDIEKNIAKIKNRYINASHYLDTRLGLVFDTLKKNGLYENTIVIVTGDHGEEFFEKGRWGHNSTFVQEQIRVPMIIHIPGQEPTVATHMTSHLDIPATILGTLGYSALPQTYSFGQNLFSPLYQRDYTVAADWHGNTLITPDIKFVLTLKGSMNGTKLSSLNDEEIKSTDIPVEDRKKLGLFIRELPRFYQNSSEFKKILDISNVEDSKLAPSNLATIKAIALHQ